MRRASLAWYTLCGATGFGVGAALTDSVYYLEAPLWHALGEHSIYFHYLFLAFVGAFGGASLGLALRDWKKAVLLGVVGAIAFGIGLGFIGMIILSMTYLSALGGLVGGAIGGAALGLAHKGVKGAVTLGWAGAIGFGLGWGLTDLLMIFGGLIPESMIFSEGMVFVWVIQVLQGVVGGAVLGAVLALSENRERRRARIPRVT
jgi:hypothetical protein